MKVKGYDFKFFLEGEEIPFADVRCQFGRISGFDIGIPPFIEATKIKPNSYGIVIFKENNLSDKWHLLCEGLFTGYNYSKSSQNKRVTLQFRDLSYLIDICRYYDFTQAKDNAFALKTMKFLGDTRTSNADSTSKEHAVKLGVAIGTGIYENFKHETDPVQNSFKWLFDEFPKSNTFLEKHCEGLKMDSSRFKTIENSKTKEVYQKTVLQRMKTMLMDFGLTASLSDVKNKILEMLHYDMMYVPGMISEDLKTYMIKPELKVSIPPACNTIFPHEVVNMSVQKDYTRRPTRYSIQGSLYGEQGKMDHYIAPGELRDIFEDDDDYITDEEKLTGVIPTYETLPHLEIMSTGVYDGTDSEFREDIAKLTDYLYHKKKYQTTPLSVSMAFKPDLIPGLNALLLDEDISVIGQVDNVSHHIEFASGSISTSVSLSYVRAKTENVPPLYGWYDEKQFSPIGINESLFGQIGTTSCFQQLNLEEERQKRNLEKEKEKASEPPTQVQERKLITVPHPESGEPVLVYEGDMNRFGSIEEMADVVGGPISMKTRGGYYVTKPDEGYTIFIPEADLNGKQPEEKIEEERYQGYNSYKDYLEQEIMSLNAQMLPQTVDGELDFNKAIDKLWEEYQYYGESKAFEKAFRRDMPVFYDESGEAQSTILDSLGLEWQEDRLVPKEDDSPLSISLETEDGTVSEVRNKAARDLRNRFDSYLKSVGGVD